MADQRTHTLQDRRRHTLHLCSHPDEFKAAFRRETGTSIDDLIASMARPERVAAAVLGGTIPLGIGSPISDVDLVLVIDDIDAMKDLPRRGDARGELRGNLVGEADTVLIAESLMLMNGIDLDVQFVLLSGVADMSRQLSRANMWVSLSGQTTQVLGRIKSGWILSSTERFELACSELLTGRALDIHCAVRNFIIGLQDLEKAKAALLDDLPMALYLGRTCVQWCLCAYFAGNGHAYLGNKWMKLLNGGGTRANGSAAGGLGSLAGISRELLFPALVTNQEDAADYLKHVTELVRSIKHLMAKDKAIRIAMALSPQVYDPVWPPASNGEMAGGSADGRMASAVSERR